MKRAGYLLILFLTALLGNGCIPWLITSSPGASGVVVDAGTFKPVRGAQAVVCQPEHFSPRRQPQTFANALTNSRPPRIITKANGRFSVRRQFQWILVPTEALMPPSGRLAISRDGYEPVLLPLVSVPGESGGFTNFLASDITNAPSLAGKLKTPRDPVSEWLAQQLSAKARQVVSSYPESGLDGAILQSLLAKELSAVVAGPLMYETNRFRDVELSSRTLWLMDHERTLSALNMDDETYRQNYPNAATPATERALANRSLLTDAFPEELSSKIGMGAYKNVGVVFLTPVRQASR